jgi:hypothetical protein
MQMAQLNEKLQCKEAEIIENKEENKNLKKENVICLG